MLSFRIINLFYRWENKYTVIVIVIIIDRSVPLQFFHSCFLLFNVRIALYMQSIFEVFNSTCYTSRFYSLCYKSFHIIFLCHVR